MNNNFKLQLPELNITMSSVEIAERTGKRHDHVKRDIEKMLTQLKISLPIFGDTYIDIRGKQQKSYNLPRRELMILLTGYSIPLRAKCLDRLDELELQASLTHYKLPNTLIGTIELYLESLKKQEEQAPKVEVFNVLMNCDECLSFLEFSKILGVKGIGRTKLMKFLYEEKILMKSNRLPYGDYMEYFNVIEKTYTHKNGLIRISKRATIRPHGQVFILNRLKLRGLI